MKWLLAIFVFIVLLVGAFFWFSNYIYQEKQGEAVSGSEEYSPETEYVRNGESAPAVSHEEAEMVGFQFMRDVVAVAPLNDDAVAANRLYDSLSRGARAQVAQETLSRDIALFVGVQDVPDQGVSVEDLVVTEESAILTLGLNYSGGRVLRNVHLVVEDGEWKVDSVSVLEQLEAE